jgi:cytochrome c553
MVARIWPALAVLLAVVVLSACGAPAASQSPVMPTEAALSGPEPTATVPVPTATTAPLPETEMSAPAVSGVSFSTDVMPILKNSCVRCHGGERTSGGLNLTTYAALMNGGESGAVVIPGDAGASLLVTLSESGKMPKRGTKLTPEQIQILKDWVNAGAPNN